MCFHPLEVDGGKFTLAFVTLEDALGFCAEIQTEMLAVDWPEELLEVPTLNPNSKI